MSEQARQVRKRRRPAFSCLECRQRKIKCDRTCPCNHCQHFGTSCVFANGIPPLNRVGTAEGLPPLKPATTPATSGAGFPQDSSSKVIRSGPNSIFPRPTQGIVSSQNDESSDSPRVRELLEKVEVLEQLLSSRPHVDRDASETRNEKTKPAKTHSKGVFSKTRYFGPSHWMSAVCLPSIAPDDFDTEAPANINDEEIDENITSLPVSKPMDTFTQTSIQIILVSSVRRRLEILQICHNLGSEPDYDDVSRLGEAMIEKCRESGALMKQYKSEGNVLSPTQLQCNMLDIYLRRFILTLYFLFATKTQDDPRHYFARKKCVDAAVTMVNYCSNENGVKQSLDDFPYDDYTCLKTRSAGFFEVAYVHSAIVIFFELVNQLKEQASFIDQSKVFRQPLKDLLNDALDLLAARIAIAENNAKGYLLFSAALGQIEALESGVNATQGAMGRAGKASEVCLRLLAAKSPLEPEFEELSVQQNEFGNQDWSLDFVMPDAWLFSGWNGEQFEGDLSHLTGA